MTSEQPSLLSYHEQQAARCSSYRVSESTHTPLTASELTTWKQRILRFQQQAQVKHSKTTQGTLFAWANPIGAENMEAGDIDIDPFQLPQKSIDFWRQPVNDDGTAALYFVIDHGWPIVLYVGETVKSNQRWKGVHDCKRYVTHYLTTHHQLKLTTQVNIGFWRDAPHDRRARQQLERRLIQHWRSPFNKENWTFWGTPFVAQHLPQTETSPIYPPPG